MINIAQLKDLIVNGVCRVLGKVYAPEFVGKLTGNADTATSATQDGNGDVITSTYAKLDSSGKVSQSQLPYELIKIELSGTLTAGATSLTLSDSGLTDNMIIEGIYTSIYGISPTNVTFGSGAITMTFDAQDTDITVKVICR